MILAGADGDSSAVSAGADGLAVGGKMATFNFIPPEDAALHLEGCLNDRRYGLAGR